MDPRSSASLIKRYQAIAGIDGLLPLLSKSRATLIHSDGRGFMAVLPGAIGE
jgi:hypothetical protein